MQTTIQPAVPQGMSSVEVVPLPAARILTYYHIPRAVCTGTAPASAPAPTASAVSYVPNNYFPFPYISTSFANTAACTSAVSQCSQNYGVCLADLQGSAGYGVTVVINGGTTVAAASAPTVGTSATAICSSLSSVACGTIQSTQCAQYGNAGSRSRSISKLAMAVAAGLAVALTAAL